MQRANATCSGTNPCPPLAPELERHALHVKSTCKEAQPASVPYQIKNGLLYYNALRFQEFQGALVVAEAPL